MAERKRRTPHFSRQESWRHVRVKKSWRRPRGKTSKMRLEMRGWPSIVKVGYKQSRKERNHHPSGLEEIIVTRPADLEGINAKTQIVKIGHRVGERNRIAIMDRAQTLELKVANPGTKKPEPMPTPELLVEEPEPTESKDEPTTTGAKTE